MKWFLIGLALAVCSATLVRGDAADLYKQGTDALAAEQYAAAAKAFDQILTGYPNTANIDNIRWMTGFAYLHAGDFADAIDRLSKETLPTAKPEFRGIALYFTGLAQFSQGQKFGETDKAAGKKALAQASATFTTLIDYINSGTASPDSKDYLEDTIYYRSLAEYLGEDYPSAEKDLQQLLQQFNASLKRPDYLLLLGSLYAVEANQAVSAKKSPDEIKAAAQKALDTYDQISNDPNALVQANDANLSKAEVLYSFIAPLNAPSLDGYQKALDAFRLVRRKEDMVALEQARLDQLKKNSADELRNNPGGASLASANSRLIDREAGRLADLQKGPDPIVRALLRMAECYNSMKQADEARTILRRLTAHASLTADQQSEVDFQTLVSYTLGGQTDKADAALTAYLGKHPADPLADSISVQIASALINRKDFTGALAAANRSMSDFPNGSHLSEAYTLKAEALKGLGRLDEANKVLTEAAQHQGSGPGALQNKLILAGTMAAQGNLSGALDAYKAVKDDPAAGELQAYGAAGYIQTLQSMQRYDEVITESQAFATKYPTSVSLPGVLLTGALAMDQKKIPDEAGALSALQDLARKYPKDDAAPYALFYVVQIYERSNNVPAMIQAADDLFKAYPTHYVELAEAADAVAKEYIKEKKFDLAAAEYQPLAQSPKPEIAATASNKIGAVWLAACSPTHYQSMQVPERDQAQKWLAAGETAYLATLTQFPDQLSAVGEAFEGLVNATRQRRSWGLLTDADLETSLGKTAAPLTSPEMQTRLELAKAGLVFVEKHGADHYAAALDRFKKAIAANPGLHLTRQEANQYGDLLLAAKDYPTALQVYTDLLASAGTDETIQADGDYGIGATYLAQGDVAKAAESFKKMKALPNGAAWHPHIQDADYGLALAAERAGDPDGLAKQTYARLMQAQTGGFALPAKSMLGYGRLLEKAGFGVTPEKPGTMETAVHYYQEPGNLYGPAVPELSAEGLYDAGKAYESANDATAAKKQYSDLIAAYGKTAPDWATKAQDALTKLGP